MDGTFMFRREAPLDDLTARAVVEALGDARVGGADDLRARLAEATHGALEVAGLEDDAALREVLDAEVLRFVPRSEGTAGSGLGLHWVGEPPPALPAGSGDHDLAAPGDPVALEVVLPAAPDVGRRAVLDALELALSEPYEGDRALPAGMQLDGATATLFIDVWEPPVPEVGQGHLRWLVEAARALFPEARVRVHRPERPLVAGPRAAGGGRRRSGLPPSFAGPVTIMLLGLAGERLLGDPQGALLAAFAWGFGALMVTRLSRVYVGPLTWGAALLAFAGNAALAWFLVSPSTFAGPPPAEAATLQAHLLYDADLVTWAERVLLAARGSGLLWSIAYLANRYRRV